MRALGILASLAICLVVFLGFGGFVLAGAVQALHDGELTYTRRGSPPVTVSLASDALSFYCQVALHAAAAGFFLLLSVAFCLYAVARLRRLEKSPAEPNDSAIHRAATFVAWMAVGSGGAWFLLRVLGPLLSR